MSNSPDLQTLRSPFVKILTVKLRSLFLALLFGILLFQNIFQVGEGEMAYADEMVTVVLFVWALFSKRSFSNNSSRQTFRALVVALLVFLMLTAAGNYWFEIQPNFTAVFIDAFSSVRFFICFYSVDRLMCNDAESLLIFQKIARLTLVIFGIFMLANIWLDVGVSFEVRYGMRAFSFFYQHPTMLSAAVVACVALLVRDFERHRFFILIAAAVLVSTLRSRSMAFAVIILAVLLYFRHRPKITFSSAASIGILAFVVGYTQLETYFGGEQTARSALLVTSFTVASRFFPLGSGFATYGSNASLNPYSPLYDELGFSQIYGLSRENSQYLVDSFWPIVIGQGGWLSLLAVILAVFAFSLDVMILSKSRNVLVWAAVTVPAYLAISSLSEAAFFSSYSALLGFTAAAGITHAVKENTTFPLLGSQSMSGAGRRP